MDYFRGSLRSRIVDGAAGMDGTYDQSSGSIRSRRPRCGNRNEPTGSMDDCELGPDRDRFPDVPCGDARAYHFSARPPGTAGDVGDAAIGWRPRDIKAKGAFVFESALHIWMAVSRILSWMIIYLNPACAGPPENRDRRSYTAPTLIALRRYPR